MESIKKLISRFSLFVAAVTFVTCLLNGISLGTSIVRTFIVYLGMIFIFVVFLKILRWALLMTGKPQTEQAIQQKSD